MRPPVIWITTTVDFDAPSKKAMKESKRWCLMEGDHLISKHKTHDAALAAADRLKKETSA